MNENLDKLIWSYLDGDADRDQVEQLEAILRDDAAARAEFLRAASMDHELTRVCGVALSEESPSAGEAMSAEGTQLAHRPLPGLSIANVFSHPVRIAAAATLVLSLGLLAVVYVRNLSQSAVQGIAAIESREGSVFCRAPGTESERRVEAGESLADGSELVTRENGTVGILFRDRSAVRLEPGSVVSIAKVGNMIEVRQTRGALIASVTRQTRTDAYLFSTPHAEVRIHGTKFRLSTDDKKTEVVVSEGEVAVTGRKDRETARVLAGQSCLVVTGIVSPPQVGGEVGMGGKSDESLDPRFGGVFFKKYADIYDSEKKFALDVLNPEVGPVLHRLSAGMAKELRASSSNSSAEVSAWSGLVNGEDSVGVRIGNMTTTWWNGQIPLPAIAADAYTVGFRHIFRKALRENSFVFGFHLHLDVESVAGCGLHYEAEDRPRIACPSQSPPGSFRLGAWCSDRLDVLRVGWTRDGKVIHEFRLLQAGRVENQAWLVGELPAFCFGIKGFEVVIADMTVRELVARKGNLRP
jgi:anti-sigma factor RsiW